MEMALERNFIKPFNVELYFDDYFYRIWSHFTEEILIDKLRFCAVLFIIAQTTKNG